MDAENFLLIAAALLLILDLILIGRRKVKLRHSIYGFYASFVSFCLILIAYLTFVTGFLTSDFSLKQVYSYSSSSMSMLSKFYATWAGSVGSILLLVLFTSIAWFSLRAQGYKKQNKSNLFASLVLGVMVIFFLIAAVMMEPYSRYGVNGPIEGRGLNPVLQSAWMAIHPPIVFAGYVFVVIAFALTLAKMRTGLPNYGKLLNFSIKAGWVFLTLGIGLGGLWAYEVLGWGGYWSWDPIETASLLPWVALTIYFIVQSFPNSKKTLLSELSILVAFSSLMFLSALTRGGLLQSVHAYGLSPAGPFILLFGVVMIGCFFYLKINNAKPLFSIRFDRQLLSSWSVTLTLVCLVGIFLVCFSGIAYSMVARAIDTNAAVAGVAFYNYANFPFVIGLLFALISFSLKSKAPLKLYIVLIFAIAISSGTLLLLGWPTNNNIANLGLPLIISSLFAAVVGFGSAIKSHRAPFLGRALIHFGLIVILLGVFISATSQQVTTLNAVRVGSTLEASGLTLSITDCNGCTDNNLIELSQGILPQSSNLLINTVVTDGKSTYNTGISVYLYSAYGLVSQPTIIRTGTDDIYIHLNITQEVYNSLLNSLVGNYSEPETFVVNVERIPMINLIWIGVSLLVIGGTINIISGIQRPKTQRKTT